MSKKQSILQAARCAFLMQGFHEAKIETIAKQAGVGKGTVYQYFHSKEDLFRAMIEDTLVSYTDSLKQCLEDAPPLREGIYRITSMHQGLFEQEKDLTQLFFGADMKLDETLKEQLFKTKEQAIMILGTWATHLIASGELPDTAPFDLMFSMLFGTINQYYGQQAAVHTKDKLTVSAFADKITRLMHVLIS